MELNIIKPYEATRVSVGDFLVVQDNTGEPILRKIIKVRGVYYTTTLRNGETSRAFSDLQDLMAHTRAVWDKVIVAKPSQVKVTIDLSKKRQPDLSWI